MEIITVLQSMGLSLAEPMHAAAANDVAADPEHAPVKYDDLDLSSLRGLLELQNRLDQAIAEACWRERMPNVFDARPSSF